MHIYYNNKLLHSSETNRFIWDIQSMCSISPLTTQSLNWKAGLKTEVKLFPLNVTNLPIIELKQSKSNMQIDILNPGHTTNL